MFYPLELIDDNPYQPRSEYAGIEELAADIEANGLLQAPRGRFTPPASDGVSRVQLQFGHRRLRAFRLLAKQHPGDPRWAGMSVDIDELSDRQMFDRAIAENAQRSDLSAIEKARSIRRYLDEFHVSQAEAARAFGLGSQGAVSNLLRLLKLPESMRDLVHAGELPERLARQMLPLAAAMPDKAAAFAVTIAEAENKELVFDEKIDELLRDHGTYLHQTPFGKDLDWPKEPIPVPELVDKGLSTVRACNGCEYSIKTHYSGSVCVNALCMKTKRMLYTMRDLEAASKRSGIPVAGIDEKVQEVYTGEWSQRDLLAAAVKSKHESLRLIPSKYRMQDPGYSKQFGEWVGIGTVNMAALKKALPKSERKTPEQEHEDWKAREEQRVEERKAKIALCDQLIDAGAAILAPRMPLQPDADLMIAIVRTTHARLEHEIDAYSKQKKLAERQVLMARMMIILMGGYSSWGPSTDDVINGVDEVATLVGIKVPPTWTDGILPVEVKVPARKAKAKK
jgi:ParB/RepB/Spo0J family partition protein